MLYIQYALLFVACLLSFAHLLSAQQTVHTQPRPLPVQAFNTSHNAVKVSGTHNTTRAYNKTALIEALNHIMIAILDAVEHDSKNPMAGPSLRDPAVSKDLDTIEKAILLTGLLESNASAVKGPAAVVDDAVVGNSSNGKDVVYLKNKSAQDICYYLEFSSGAFLCPDTCNFDRDSLPGSAAGIVVPANSSRTVFTNSGFNGPFNVIIDGVTKTRDNGSSIYMHGVRGARHEINFAAEPNGVWYDIDYEFGLSNSTIAPSDGRPTSSGSPSLQGETNILAKANAVWQDITTIEKWALVTYPDYIGIAPGPSPEFPHGNITRLHHDKGAPPEIDFFLQMSVGLQGYVVPGSFPAFAESAQSLRGKMRPVADSFSWHVHGSHNMTIVAY